MPTFSNWRGAIRGRLFGWWFLDPCRDARHGDRERQWICWRGGASAATTVGLAAISGSAGVTVAAGCSVSAARCASAALPGGSISASARKSSRPSLSIVNCEVESPMLAWPLARPDWSVSAASSSIPNAQTVVAPPSRGIAASVACKSLPSGLKTEIAPVSPVKRRRRRSPRGSAGPAGSQAAINIAALPSGSTMREQAQTTGRPRPAPIRATVQGAHDRRAEAPRRGARSEPATDCSARTVRCCFGRRRRCRKLPRRRRSPTAGPMRRRSKAKPAARSSLRPQVAEFANRRARTRHSACGGTRSLKEFLIMRARCGVHAGRFQGRPA